MIVDVHTHMIPWELVELLSGDRGPRGVSVERRDGDDPLILHEDGLQYPVFSLFHDPEVKLEQMDRDGIDVSVLSLSATLFLYGNDPHETVRMCRVVNDGAAALMSAAPGRIYAMAAVPMNDPASAAKELRRAREGLGLVGVSIGPSVGERQLDSQEFDPFWNAAEELATPVLLHPYTSMTMDPPAGLAGFHLANVIGNPLETFIAASRLIVGGTLDRHPELRVQLVHGGGSFPYQLGRLEHAYNAGTAANSVAREPPAAYLRNFLFDTVIFEQRTLEYLIGRVGAERVMFGTDRPYEMADLSAMRLTETAGPEVAERILARNALEAFGIDAYPADDPSGARR